MARLALACALGALLLVPPAAAGGGWWSSIQVDRSPVAPGQRVEVDAAVLFDSAAAAQAAREPGRFSVVLLRGLDHSVVDRAMRRASPGDWWSLGGAEAIEVARVTVTVSDANFGRATAAFTMPELEPATYDVMLCDAGCAEPLADVVPTRGITVVADPATARLVRRVARLERQSRKDAGQLAMARAAADQSRAAVRNARAEVVRLERDLSSRDSQPSAAWLVAGALAGALALTVRARSRAAR